MERTLRLAAPLLLRCFCREPFGGPDDVGNLAEEIRKGTGGKDLPTVVLSLPASWTYLRQVELPVNDLQRAKKIHVSELEGSLPLEDEAILSDLLPSPPGQPGKFLAVAARRDAVEKTVAVFTAAGFRVDRVVTDHVSILSAFLSANALPEGLVLSTLSDIVILRTEGGAVRWARQFPAAMASDSVGLAKEWRELLQGDPPSDAAIPVTLLGDPPAALSGELAGAVHFRPPDAEDVSLLAYGAARVFSFPKGLGGFSSDLRGGGIGAGPRAAKGPHRRRRRGGGASSPPRLPGSREVGPGKKVAAVRAQIRKEFSEAVPGRRWSSRKRRRSGEDPAPGGSRRNWGRLSGLSASLMKISRPFRRRRTSS